MLNVYAIRSFALSNIEHVKKIRPLRITQRTQPYVSAFGTDTTYAERSQNVYQRTLTYVNGIRWSVTALKHYSEQESSAYCFMYFEYIILSGRWFLFGQQTSVFVVFDCQRAIFLILSLSWKYWFWFTAKWKVLFIAIINGFIIWGLILLSYTHIISSGQYREWVYKDACRNTTSTLYYGTRLIFW